MFGGQCLVAGGWQFVAAVTKSEDDGECREAGMAPLRTGKESE